MNALDCPYWRRLATSVIIVVAACFPLIIGDRPTDAVVLPWSWIGFVRENFDVFRGWEWDVGVWPLIYGFGTASLLTIAAKWKKASVVVTIWFAVNVLAGYLLLRAYGHS